MEMNTFSHKRRIMCGEGYELVSRIGKKYALDRQIMVNGVDKL